MNTSLVRRDLLNSLKDQEFREAFNEENVYTGICFQIQALREQQDKSQKQLGKEAGMAQERISILEDPNAKTKPAISTLLRLANALEVGLDVRFVPYSIVLERSVQTDAKHQEVQKFSKELPAMELAIDAELSTRKQAKPAPAAANRVAIVSRATQGGDSFEYQEGAGQGSNTANEAKESGETELELIAGGMGGGYGRADKEN